MIPDLRSFDWILINTSSGKDSQTMMRLVVARCKEAGVDPGRLVAVHADLGRIEWPGCRELAGGQAEHYGLRFEVVRRNGGDLLEYARKRGKWPSSQQRWCTSDFKRGPIRRVMTRLTNDLLSWVEDAYPDRPFQPVRILNCMGMRAEESPARAKKQPFEFDEGASNGRRHVYNWLPIHQMGLDEVWADIRQSGVPHHYAYDLGMPRLSCSFCIFAPPAALRLAGRARADLLAEYVQVEQEINHSFRKDLKLYYIQQQIINGPDEERVEDWRM